MFNPIHPDYSNTPASNRRKTWHYSLESLYDVPLYSIVTPFYNTDANIFQETATSVLKQSLQRFEWIIINDGSDLEKSKKILNELSSKDLRIKVYHNDKSKGPSAARNLGYQVAKTDFILQLDSDDLIEPTAAEKLYCYLQLNPDVSFAKGYVVGFGSMQYSWEMGFHSDEEFLTRNCVNSTAMVRRKAHFDAGGFDESLTSGAEDWDFWLRCANSGHWGSSIREHTDWYRRRKHHSDRWPNFEDNRLINFQKTLADKYPKLWQKNGFPKVKVETTQNYAPLPPKFNFLNPLKKNKKRILFMVNHLCLGGADKFVIDLIKQLVERFNFDVSIIVTHTSYHDWRHLYAEHTEDIFILDHFLEPIEFPCFIEYFCISRKIDLLFVTQTTLGYNLLPHFKQRFPCLPIIDIIHIVEDTWQSGGFPRYSINYSNFLDRTIVVSKNLKNWLIQENKQKEKNPIDVVYIGCDTNEWCAAQLNKSELKEKWSVKKDVPIIAFSGRIVEQKQPHVLIQTVHKLKESGLKFQLLIAGDGQLKNELIQYIQNHNLNDVCLFLGVLKPQEVKEILAMSDIFFLPSNREGISLAIYEAMSMELAIVGADVGGQAELVTKDCGILINRDQNEVNNYSDLLIELIKDPKSMSEMGRNSRNRIVAKFTLDMMGDTVERTISRVFSDEKAYHQNIINENYSDTVAVEAIEQFRTVNALDNVWQNYCEVQRQLNPYQSLKSCSLGKEINLSEKDNTSWYCIKGWSEPESWGIWSTGNHSIIGLLIDGIIKKPLLLRIKVFSVFVNMEDEMVQISINVNEQAAERLEVTTSNIPDVIEIKLCQKLFENFNQLIIDFFLPDAKSPKSLGLSNDYRNLCLGIESFCLTSIE